MTQIMCIGDIHARDRAPRNAAASYMDDIIEELRWCADECERRGITTCVWAGDVFDHKLPSKTSHALVLRMIEVVRYFTTKSVEVIIVTGNHDISNDVLESLYEKQPLGVLIQAGAKELDGWHPKLPLFGVPWRHDWTTSQDAAWDAFEAWREDSTANIHRLGTSDDQYRQKALAVTHAPIYPPGEAEKQLFELVPTMGDHGISHAMGNMGFLYCGHIHEDHGVFEVEGVTYCNVGAISRGSLTEYNINRQIKAAIWSEDGFEEIVIPHKPAAEVLRVEEVAQEKADKLSLDQFLSDVGRSELDISSTASVISHIRSRTDVEERVRKVAVEILEEMG